MLVYSRLRLAWGTTCWSAEHISATELRNYLRGEPIKGCVGAGVCLPVLFNYERSCEDNKAGCWCLLARLICPCYEYPRQCAA